MLHYVGCWHHNNELQLNVKSICDTFLFDFFSFVVVIAVSNELPSPNLQVYCLRFKGSYHMSAHDQ